MAFSKQFVDTVGRFHPWSSTPDTRLLQATLALLSDHGQFGGLSGLHERFQETGLGRVIASWIGPQPNMPVAPDEVAQVLGFGAVQQIAEETALDQQQVLDRLSNMLPNLVDRLTPEGRQPAQGLGNVASLLERVMAA